MKEIKKIIMLSDKSDDITLFIVLNITKINKDISNQDHN